MRGEAASFVIPDVGEGQCVKPGPDGKPQPCGQESRPTTPRVTPPPRIPKKSSGTANRSSVPCNQVPWENNQKKQCAQRVNAGCKQTHEEGTKEFQACVFEGLTGGGKARKPLPKESKKKGRVHTLPTTSPQSPSLKKPQRIIEVPATQSVTPPSPSHSSTLEEPSPPPTSIPPPKPTEQCIFPFPPDCRGKCAGLPSYPTYKFEDCLTRCDQTYQTASEEYNRCREKK